MHNVNTFTPSPLYNFISGQYFDQNNLQSSSELVTGDVETILHVWLDIAVYTESMVRTADVVLVLFLIYV